MSRSEEQIFSVYELSHQLKELFNAPIFQYLTVVGEIKSITIRNGTSYITLIDTDEGGKTLASISVILFKSGYGKPINVGDKVIVRGKLNYYQPTGALSFIANSIDPYGHGNELARLRAVYEKLKLEGAFAEERKRPLPKYPHKIAIITSGEGAAYRDIINTLKSRFPVSTVLYDAKVQGEAGPASIIKALGRAYQNKDVDLIIIGRGGGSKSDLMAFNDEFVVRTILQSPVPVISAVGHEIDTSLTDYAADAKAITPTAAAVMSVPALSDIIDMLAGYQIELENALNDILDDKLMDLMEKSKILSENSPQVRLSNYEKRVLSLHNRLDASINKVFEGKRRNLEQSNIRLSECNPKSMIQVRVTKISNLESRLIRVSNEYLLDKEHKVDTYMMKLESLNPYNVLNRGYAMVSKGKTPKSSVKDIKVNDELMITMKDGTIKTIAKEVNIDGREN